MIFVFLLLVVARSKMDVEILLEILGGAVFVVNISEFIIAGYYEFQFIVGVELGDDFVKTDHALELNMFLERNFMVLI